MIHDKINNSSIYPLGPHWKKAFDFIATVDADTEEKRYELEDGMYASIESYATRPIEKAIFESHQKFVDIQWTIVGAEGILVTPTSELQIQKEYNTDRDVAFYQTPEIWLNTIKNYPGVFSVFWPDDAHMPKVCVDSIDRVKKGVVKIPVELL